MSARSQEPTAGGLPWDQLKSETLRLICKDLGLPGRRRDEMRELLVEVNTHGLEVVLSDIEEKKRKAQEAGSDESSTKKPRKASVQDAGKRRSLRSALPEHPVTRRARSSNPRKLLDGVVLSTSRRARSTKRAR